MQSILDFLTGGVFNTLKELIVNIIQYIIRFIFNILNSLLDPLINGFFGLLPNIDLSYFDFSILDGLLNIINYIVDATFIDKYVIYLAISSIIFRISYKIMFYVIKLLVNWYHMLMP